MRFVSFHKSLQSFESLCVVCIQRYEECLAMSLFWASNIPRFYSSEAVSFLRRHLTANWPAHTHRHAHMSYALSLCLLTSLSAKSVPHTQGQNGEGWQFVGSADCAGISCGSDVRVRTAARRFIWERYYRGLLCARILPFEGTWVRACMCIIGFSLFRSPFLSFVLLCLLLHN